MKSTLTKWVISSVVLGLTAFPLTAAAPAKAPQPPTPAQAAVRERREGEERHPQIHAALRALETAKHHLESAAHDFGGHRAKALALTDEAIKECHEALEYDKK